jgi:hypothetical protein
MKIISSAFENNSKIPAKYTCDGENINPPLSFSDIPANAKSLVLIVDDPDAPNETASNAADAFVHWILFNIDPETIELKENSSLQGQALRGKTSAGKTDYVGACPPSGTHRYFFKLYALDTVLNLTNSDKATLEKEMQGHILDSAELIGLYSRI